MDKQKKRVLIITYYWPPSGGPGVQRCLYFVKYLRDFGWEPVVYTVDQGEYPYLDKSLEKEIPEGVVVLRHKAWEPFRLYKRLMGIPEMEKLKPNVIVEKSSKPWLQKISTFIRGNFFIPDARMFWIKPSVKFLTEYLRENPVDVIMTSSPPHSVQMIGYYLKQKTGLPWHADFRDPWTKIFFWDKLKMTNYAKKRNAAMEKKVLKNANSVTTVGYTWARDFEAISSRHVDVITNGFDQLRNVKNVSDTFILAYGGTLSGDRNPENLWKAISEYFIQNIEFQKSFKIQFIGAIDPYVFDSMKHYGLGRNLEIHDALSHSEYLSKIELANALLLIGTKNDPGVITGKFFEYLALQKPILSISPKGSDLEILLKETQAGLNVDYENYLELLYAFEKIISLSKFPNEFIPNRINIEQFSRKCLTQKLTIQLNKLIKDK